MQINQISIEVFSGLKVFLSSSSSTFDFALDAGPKVASTKLFKYRIVIGEFSAQDPIFKKATLCDCHETSRCCWSLMTTCVVVWTFVMNWTTVGTVMNLESRADQQINKQTTKQTDIEFGVQVKNFKPNRVLLCLRHAPPRCCYNCGRFLRFGLQPADAHTDKRCSDSHSAHV